jgi:CubicO group peptidase (beta-lactamase class C family)
LKDSANRATASGATFTVPAGWSIQSNGTISILVGPEPDIGLAIVDAGSRSAEEAVVAAWKALRPDFKRPIHLATPFPGRDGWDEGVGFEYETSPDEKLALGGSALRHGDTWVGLVFHSGMATAEKRSSEVNLVGGSLRPHAYERESFKGKTAHVLDADRIKQITDFIQTAQKELGIPGVAISLLQGGKVVFEGGFGVRELGKPAPVDADTLFIIASNTKALSTLLLAKEIDEGKFTWDTPVTDVYPSFKLGDADTTRQVLMKHLVCACTGMPRQDLELVFDFNRMTADGALKALAASQPTTKFGETFQYSNSMATAAGFIAGHVAYPQRELGAAYDEAMKKKIFEPLGMKHTTFDFATALRGNHASPHDEDIDGNERLAPIDASRCVIPIRPAGGAWSSVRDMSRYVAMELANGKLPDGTQLVSEKNVLARRLPQVSMGEDSTYGMGLMVGTGKGTPLVHHGGDDFGYHSEMFWLPEHGVGGVILTNGGLGPVLRGEFIRKVREVLFDAKPEALEDIMATSKAIKASLAKERPRFELPANAEVAAKLAKHYKSDALGELHVTTKGAHTIFDFGEWKSEIASHKNDDGTMSVVLVDPGAVKADLVVGERGGKRALTVRDAQHEYVFEEVP